MKYKEEQIERMRAENKAKLQSLMQNSQFINDSIQSSSDSMSSCSNSLSMDKEDKRRFIEMQLKEELKC